MGYFWVVKWLKVAFDFYIRSSLHVAVAASCLLMVTAINSNETVSYLMVFSVFLGTFAGYNFINGNIRLNSKSKRQFLIKILAILSLVIVGCLFWLFTIQFRILTAIAAILSMFYMIPFWKGKSLRYFPIVKLGIVAIVWTIITYGLIFTCCTINELYLGGLESGPKVIGLLWRIDENDILQRFILIFALCIPFEIRDLKYDQEDLKTLPQLFGTTVSKVIGIVLLMYYCWITIQQTGYEGYSIYTRIELVMLVITTLAIWFSDKFKSDYYASFIVEAIPVLWLMILWLF